MALEATIVCLDNSEWMRNGDFAPSRAEAQKDAVNLICASKTQSNPESAVAIMSMAGKTPEVLVTLTQELSKVLGGAQEVKISGKIDFSTTMQIAQLALRHRQNKHQHPRIIAFVGSPLKETKEELIQLAKRLKKNSVAVDIINFGEITENTDKLEAFFNDVNNNDESHLLTVPPGPHILSDIILQSPIVDEGSGQFGSEFINADTDPDLAMALKLSLEEEKQRQERERKAREEQNGGAPTTTAATESSNTDVNFEEDPELAEALALSLATDKMDVQPSTDSQDPSAEAFKDQDFLNSTLNSLPGVDPNRIKNELENLEKKDEDKKDEEKK
ncbi:hypothetical protein DICPUDRAFT_44919 [Dictyostelium purpureum]|uniref:VWFA domain-containing protein n=1 Tax=Dictyostelium purpureum TaxID=5786 RepID=F0Z839_DICPU|nr:uncharacterized protein DICPUDRAFT_44919 [Dictyostelium purpureum]EGC39861.1 hypothetical protein DICPUDRAFT_44919 [Dictyostelium purpureum]|eukprot:XP_003283612.1 hypothetical protein DICPUDRAFT_44919 [Dictyostelium purpureum]